MAADAADGWTPEFAGQRAPFTGGNEAAVTHGAHSGRRAGPLAEQIARELLEDPETPPHVREPVFAAAVTAWARALRPSCACCGRGSRNATS